MFQLQSDVSSQFSKVSAEMVVNYNSEFITYEVNLFELFLSYCAKIFLTYCVSKTYVITFFIDIQELSKLM